MSVIPSLTPSSLPRLLVVAVLLALPLSACGRKGPLEPPPGAVDARPDPMASRERVEGGDAVDPTPGKVIAPSISPVAGRGSRGKGKPITAPRERFVLDPIL